MIKKNAPLFICTLLLIGTMVGCAYWVADAINDVRLFLIHESVWRERLPER